MNQNDKKVFELIKEYHTLQKDEIIKKANISDEEVFLSLEKLQNLFLISMDKDKKYRLVLEKRKIGKVISIGEITYVDVEGTLVPVTKEHQKKVLVGDYVLIRVRNAGYRTMDGIIEEKLQHELGEIVYKDGEYLIEVPCKNADLKLKISDEKYFMKGLLVNFEYGKEIEPYTYSTNIVKVVGHIDNPNSTFKKMVYPSGIETEFPYDVIQASGKISNQVLECEKKGRVDLTKETIFTIDGDSSKDFDDAVSIKKKDNGNFLLSVHIADVSYYVKEGTLLDKEAYKRGSSVYVMNRVVPMLPHKLSTGICSLNPNVDRLTITLEMEIDSFGNVIDSSLYESVIHSKKRMKYHEVDECFDKGFLKEYEPFQNDLKEMLKLSKILHQKRVENGSIEFDVPELELQFDESGKPIDIKARERGTSEHIIEEFMILANTTVAKKLKDFPAPRRVNPKPDNRVLKNTVSILKSFYEQGKIEPNVYFEMKPMMEEIMDAKEGTYIEPKTIQRLLFLLKKTKECNLTSNMILSSMKRAYYTTSNETHYALALNDYTHFTSPIRRYPDLMVHRSIKRFLLRTNYDYDTIRLLEQKNEEMMDYISKKEKKIQRCERMIESKKQLEYMKDKIGMVYDGYIEQISKNGIQVIFDDVMVGKIPQDLVESDYQIGDPITIQIKDVNFNHCTLVLKPVKEKVKTLMR